MLIDLIGYLVPRIVSVLTAFIAYTTKLEKKLESAFINLLDIDVLAQLMRASSPTLSTVTASLSSI